MGTLLRKIVPARELPAAWREEGRYAPEEPVAVTVEPAAGATAQPSSPLRFIGAGRGLFGSAQEIDEHLGRQRDAWTS
jgi:hypothetical protein